MGVFVFYLLFILSSLCLGQQQLRERAIIDFSRDNQFIIQEVLDGIFRQNILPKSISIVDCMDQQTAQKMVNKLAWFLDRMAKGSLDQYRTIHGELVSFYINDVPRSVSSCLEDNQEIGSLTANYGIYGGDLTEFNRKFSEYTNMHYINVHKFFNDFNRQFLKNQFYQTGYDGAEIFHKIVGYY